MVAVMQRLEPRQFLPSEIIYHDMEEVNEIIFIQTGDVSSFSNIINEFNSKKEQTVDNKKYLTADIIFIHII
jgi:hypothetical protein